MLDAILFKHEIIVHVLRKAGAHLSQTEETDVAHYFCQAVIKNDLEQVKLFSYAGADPNISVQDGRTPLHLVLLFN